MSEIAKQIAVYLKGQGVGVRDIGILADPSGSGRLSEPDKVEAAFREAPDQFKGDDDVGREFRDLQETALAAVQLVRSARRYAPEATAFTARPAARVPGAKREPPPAGIYLPGLGVSAGPGRWVTGRARFDPAEVHEGDILVRELIQPGEAWTAMQRAGGILTTRGGFLSHAAVGARELGKHAVILEGGEIQRSKSGHWALVVKKGERTSRIEGGDRLRILGASEGGGVVVHTAKEWYHYDGPTRAQFWLEELLFGASGHEEARTQLRRLISQRRVGHTRMQNLAAELFADAARATQELLDDERWATPFKLEKLEELIAALLRLEPFLDPAKFQPMATEFEARGKTLRAQVAEEAQAAAPSSKEPVARRQLSREEENVAGLKLFFRLDEVDERYIPFVGGKFARLGDVARMEELDVKVPLGIGLSRLYFESFLDKAGIRESFNKIQSEINRALQAGNLSEQARREQVEGACHRMQELLKGVPVSIKFVLEISGALESADLDSSYFAVRSSGITEDAKGGAYAGMARTHLNVYAGVPEYLLMRTQDVWASFWEPAGVFYRYQRSGQTGAPRVAVLIQEMIDGEVSGVVFSKDPTGSKTGVVITAGYGLGEGVVSGQVETDYYLVNEEGRIEVRLARKTQQIIPVPDEEGGTELVEVHEDLGSRSTLSDPQIHHLAKVARRLREHFGFEVDMEFTIRNGEIYILQVRPITEATTLSRQETPTDRAIRLLQETDRPMVYFVCNGNRHRSALMHLLMQEALDRAGLGEAVGVRSGGLAVYSGEIRDLDLDLVRFAAEAGVDEDSIGSFHTKPIFEEEDEEGGEPTLILVAEEGMKEEIMQMFPDKNLADRLFTFNELAPHAFPGAGPDVEDTVGLTVPRRSEIFRGIQRGVEDLLSLVREALTLKEVVPELMRARPGERTPSPTLVDEDEDIGQIIAQWLEEYPEEAETFARLGWSREQRDEVMATIVRKEMGGYDYEDEREHLSTALEDLAQTGWPVPLQLKVLLFTIHLYDGQLYTALEDIELALLDKIDLVMETESLGRTEKLAIIDYLKEVTIPKELRQVAAAFAKRCRFHGLRLLREHFGVPFPLDKTQVGAVRATLVAAGDYKTVADLDEAMNEMDNEIEDLARKERARRLNRSRRGIDHERKILFDEISEFYIIQAIRKKLSEARKYQLPRETAPLFRKLEEAFAVREGKIFNWIRDYLITAVYGELNHYQDSAQSKLVGHVGIFLSGRREMDLDVETFKEGATEEEVRLFFMGAMQRFSAEEWRKGDREGNIVGGGPKWSRIAELGLKLWQAKAPDVLLIDLAFHLEHNEQMAFDKSPEEIVMGEKDTLLLDLKRDVGHVDRLFAAVRDRLQPETRRRIGDWLETLRAIESSLSGGAEGADGGDKLRGRPRDPHFLSPGLAEQISLDGGGGAVSALRDLSLELPAMLRAAGRWSRKPNIPVPDAVVSGTPFQVVRLSEEGETRDTDLRDRVVAIAVKWGLNEAAVVAKRLSDKAFAALARRDVVEHVLARRGYQAAAAAFKSHGEIDRIRLMMLALAALAGSDEEVALAVERISGKPTAALQRHALPPGFSLPSVGLRGVPPLVMMK